MIPVRLDRRAHLSKTWNLTALCAQPWHVEISGAPKAPWEISVRKHSASSLPGLLAGIPCSEPQVPHSVPAANTAKLQAALLCARMQTREGSRVN